MAKPTLYSLIIKFILLFTLQTSFAQDRWQNQKKYWFYKARLNNDFTKVGLNAGESFIVGQRVFNHYISKFKRDLKNFSRYTLSAIRSSHCVIV